MTQEIANETNMGWFVDLLMKFAPTSVETNGQTPEEMTSSASWKAFMISFAASLPPGFVGWATILPELIALTKLQMNLIYRIAKFHGKENQINATLVVLIFANQAGIGASRAIMKRVGRKLIIHALSSKTLRPLAQKVAARVGARITRKLLGRWLPFVLAPVFGAFSKSMTTDIGREADRLFGDDIEVIKVAQCSNGHEVPQDSNFCQECGVTMKKAWAV